MPGTLKTQAAKQPASGFDFAKAWKDSSDLIKIALLLTFCTSLPTIHRLMNYWTGGYHVLLCYLVTLGVRYYQHAPWGTPLYRDPDVALFCRIVKGGRCCRFDDMCFWEGRRIPKKWSLTEDEEEKRTPRRNGGIPKFEPCRCNRLDSEVCDFKFDSDEE